MKNVIRFTLGLVVLAVISAFVYSTVAVKSEQEIQSVLIQNQWEASNGDTLHFENEEDVFIFHFSEKEKLTAVYHVYIRKGFFSETYIVDVMRGPDKRYAEFILNHDTDVLTAENGFQFFLKE